MLKNPELTGFLAGLVAVVLIAVAAAVAAGHGQKDAATALGAVAVGIIGVLKMPMNSGTPGNG